MSKKVALNCLSCGKGFEVWAYLRVKARFCSQFCHNKFKTGKKLSPEHRAKISKGHENAIFKRPEVICLNCGKTAKRTWSGQVRCADCAKLHSKKIKEVWKEKHPYMPDVLFVCKYCKKNIKVFSYRIKQGVKYCSKECADKASIGRILPQEVIDKLKGRATWNKGIPMNLEMKLKLSKKILDQYKNGRVVWSKGQKFSESHKRKLVKAWKIQDKDKKEKRIKLMLKAIRKRPTSLEKQMIDIIKKHNLPYKYTGDGSFILGGKNPDFINVNGQKKLIEVGNTYHHDKNYASKRTNHFKKYGWETVVFVTQKLDEDKILKRLEGF